MRGGYQIVDLSGAIVGTETKVGGVYKTISGFDGKPVFIITPNTSGVFAEFTENSGMYIGAYIGSNSHLFTVSIISSDYVTIIDKGPAGGGGTSNYNELSNKPAIEGTTLSGDKSLSDLGIQGALTAGTNISISEGNEISANVSSMTAANVTFDNTGSGMSADDVQNAITELNSKIISDTFSSSSNANGLLMLNTTPNKVCFAIHIASVDPSGLRWWEICNYQNESWIQCHKNDGSAYVGNITGTYYSIRQ